MNWSAFLFLVVFVSSCHSSTGDYGKTVEVLVDSLQFVGDVAHYHKHPFTGKAVDYDSSGQKRFEAMFLKGLENGKIKEWSPAGVLQRESEAKEGKFHGKHVEYYSNGVKYHEGNYVNGLPEGVIIERYETGGIKVEQDFKRGEATGRFIYWNENGVKIMEGQQVNGKRTGKWDVYSVYGNLWLKQIWEDDELIKSEDVSR